jgi:tetratricopeptide (TPR) repeat protein
MRRPALIAAFLLATIGAFLGLRNVQRVKEERSPPGRYRAGVAALYRGHYHNAVSLLTEVLRAEPRNARAYYFRGLALRELRSLPAAIADLTHSLQLDPSLAGAAYERALARESLGDILDALSDIDALLATDSKRAELRSVRSRLLKSLGRNREAEDELNLLLKERPKSYFPLVSRAHLRRQRSDLDGSLADCNAAIALNTRLASAFLCKAYTLAGFEGQARNKEAIAAYAQAIEILPGRADIYFKRGQLHQNLYHTTEALADMTAAIGIAPQIASYWEERGHIYRNRASKEDHPEGLPLALQDLTKAIELSPKTTGGYFYRASVKIIMGRHDDAAADAKSILELDAKDAGANILLCQIYDAKKEYVKSLAFCDKAVDFSPYYASARTTRASTLRSLKRNREALEESAKAIDIEPWWDTAWLSHANAELMSGMRDKAAADCRRGLELNPNNAQLKRLLQDASSGGNF